MGIAANPLRSDYCLSFVTLSQPWLRLATKHFVRHTLVTTSYSDAKGKLLALKRFSAYLAHVPPGITPEVIDRPLIVAYEAHLRTLGVAPATIGLWLVALRTFFELCAREGWADKDLAALKDQLVQTDGILETAGAQGWTRQVEMNERIRHNLVTVIAAVESDDQAVVVGGQLPPQSAASFVPLDQL